MKCTRKNYIIVISVLSIAAVLAVVVFVPIYLTLPKELAPLSARLAEVSLDEGETLTYRVEQDIEVQVGDVQNTGAVSHLCTGVCTIYFPSRD